MILWMNGRPCHTSVEDVIKGSLQVYLDKLNRRGDGVYSITDDCTRCLGVFCESSARRLDFCLNLG